MKKFKCHKCENSGKAEHERCQHYHDVKAERAAYNAEKQKSYETQITAYRHHSCDRQSHIQPPARY